MRREESELKPCKGKYDFKRRIPVQGRGEPEDPEPEYEPSPTFP